MSETLLLRFHALGDVVLATGVAREVARVSGGSIVFATDPPFVPLLRGLNFIERVLTRDAVAGAGRFARVIDLQGTAGSRRLAAGAGPARSLSTRPLARRWLVLWGDRWPRLPVPHAIERYAEAARLTPDAGLLARCAPRLEVTDADRGEAPAGSLGRSSGAPRVALLCGASRASKEYPATALARVGELLATRGCEPLWIDPPGGRAPIEIPWERRTLPLGGLKAMIAECAGAVGSDSGPSHLAAALGVPTLTIFGSTVRAFGFAPSQPHTRVIEVEGLACRPCGVHGRSTCWLGHWRCVREIAPEIVARNLLDLLAATVAARRPGANDAAQPLLSQVDAAGTAAHPEGRSGE